MPSVGAAIHTAEELATHPQVFTHAAEALHAAEAAETTLKTETQLAEEAWKAHKADRMAHGGKGYTKFAKGAWKHKYKLAGAAAATSAMAAPKWTHDTMEEGAKHAADALKNLFGAAGDGV